MEVLTHRHRLVGLFCFTKNLFMQLINIARQFSKTPAGRYYADGPDSGERFRDEYLEPALRCGDQVAVEIDGTHGYSSSFLEEAFGGIVRKLRMTLAEASRRICIVGDETSFKQEIEHHIRQAAHNEHGG
jgi:hypothetical protein